jgi:hypothetical protein
VALAQLRNELFDGSATGFAHDVANEENFHAASLTTKCTKHTKETKRLLRPACTF